MRLLKAVGGLIILPGICLVLLYPFLEEIVYNNSMPLTAKIFDWDYISFIMWYLPNICIIGLILNTVFRIIATVTDGSRAAKHYQYILFLILNVIMCVSVIILPLIVFGPDGIITGLITLLALVCFPITFVFSGLPWFIPVSWQNIYSL